MTEFTSEIKTIYFNEDTIFGTLSDLSKLELVKDRIPEDKIKDFRFDKDSCSFRVDPVGEVCFRVVEREPNKLLKLKSEKFPFDVFLWIQLVRKAEKDTKMKLTLRADLPPLVRGMVSKPLKEALDRISDVIASLPYEDIG